ncbi:MAG: hypothetical protein J2P54_14185 [Bradyrhizobiaceae bacterium]|nr:hypothetical protein [Bradyrhizobiaceae bacterium]
MARKKPPHAADVHDANVVANAVRFEISVFLGTGKFAVEAAKTLSEAQSKAAELEAKFKHRKAMIYGIDANDRRALVVPVGVEPEGIPEFLKRQREEKAKEVPVSDLRRSLDAHRNNLKPNQVQPTIKQTESPEMPTKAKTSKQPVKTQKAAKAAKPVQPAKGKPAAAAGSKSETVLAMLKKGATRAQIVEATGWQVDLKQFAKRKGLKLTKNADGVIKAS